MWQDRQRAQQLSKEEAHIDRVITPINQALQQLDALDELLEMACMENDDAVIADVVADLQGVGKTIDDLEFQRMFNNPHDPANAYIDIQAGSGGTEAQDWANMLLRMYLRWAESHQFKTEMLDYSHGDVAGIKNATILVSGSYAFGWARTETGVHRLVRKSPFDSNSKRHTSFASVFVSPEINDDIEIDVNPADLRVDTYRSSGAGGQHVNTTDSAVRITHLPTATVVQCQNQRSQHQNRDKAMQQLRAKLYEIEMLKQRAERDEVEANKSDIGWGSQIRSYVLDDARIKDLRTGHETGNTQAVLNGDIDAFLIESLRTL